MSTVQSLARIASGLRHLQLLSDLVEEKQCHSVQLRTEGQVEIVERILDPVRAMLNPLVKVADALDAMMHQSISGTGC